MYLAHYGIKEKPFEISPNPEFLWLGEKHREGLAILKYGILENKGFLLITGEVGTGKTALIRSIEKDLQARAIVVTIPDPGMSLMDFYNYMAAELKMDRNFNNKGEFLIYFKRLILSAFSSYRRVLLIIDEAQRLNHDLIEEIRLLSNIDLAGKVLINIFFVGQTEFREILAREENRAVRQRITVSYHIQPLTEEEVHNYINHRLKVAGTTREIFSPEAAKAVHRFTRGYPRLINILCDHALMSGYTRGLDRIDAGIVAECEQELRITMGPILPQEKPAAAAVTSAATPAPRPAAAQSASPRSARSVLIFASFLALFALGWYFWGDSLSDGLAQWGKGREPRGPLSSTGSDSGDRLGRAPALPVERNQGQPPPAEPAAPETPPPPAAAMAAAADKPDAKPPVSGPDLAKAELKTLSPPPATAPAQVEKPAAPAPAASSVAPAAPELFKLKEFIVYFTQNSTEVPIYAQDILATVAALMKSNAATSASIEGHTDSVGDPTYNRYISENRAGSVKAILVERGVAAARISTQGFGSDKPLDTNGTPEGRSKNRRVVIRIVQGKQG